MLVLDLEDAVSATDKLAAREYVRDWLRSGGRDMVRINAAGTTWFRGDLEMAAQLGCPVMVAKAEDPVELAEITERGRGGLSLVPLIESAEGIVAAERISRVDGVIRTAFGSIDFATQLGIGPNGATSV
jgi:citrate lyase subunit beta/citryl-CoA lyase